MPDQLPALRSLSALLADLTVAPECGRCLQRPSGGHLDALATKLHDHLTQLQDQLATLVEAQVGVSADAATLAARLGITGATLEVERAARQRAEAEVRRLNEELETRVVQRTEALTEANTVLQHEVLQRQLTEAQLRQRAAHDALTGLPNRSPLLTRLARCIDHKRRYADYQFAVLFLDLDSFKDINDTHGHAVGDELLVAVADLLQRSLRTLDTIVRPVDGLTARLGGDEFVVLLDGLRSMRDAARVAGRIQEALAAPLQLAEHTVHVSASIGIAPGEADRTPAELLHSADAAMYRAKQAGKRRYAIFHAALQRAAQQRLQLENDLREAVADEALDLVYQPIIDLDTGRIYSFEALLRWHHPRLGRVPPEEFVPVAEETGLIVALGRWLLGQACAQLAQWRSLPGQQGIRAAVNVTRRELAEPGFVAAVQSALTAHKLPPAALALEVTENALLQRDSAITQVLHDLRALGVALHLDDFGTGYSSLSCLQYFPLDVIKIDRSFVAHMEGNRDYSAVINAIINLAVNLNLRVTGEGIESLDQLAQLLSVGCDYGQGYYFAEGVNGAAAARMLTQELPWLTVTQIAERRRRR